jgi:methionyl aminopeptidase
MTIAIEPIYAMGRGEIVYKNTDGWTLATRDRSLTSVFEHTLAITATGPVILTAGAN